MESLSGLSAPEQPTPQLRYDALDRTEQMLLQRAASGSIHEREVALREILAEFERNQDLFSPATTGNRELRDFARTIVIPLVESGEMSGALGVNINPGPYRTEMVTAENHPELYWQTLEMNRQLNERHGTRYPPADVMIVDNDDQVGAYSHAADLIVISRRTLDQGHAPALIAHEFAERQGSFVRGDFLLNQEIELRDRLGLAQPPSTIERHRANECREDADAITLVGPDVYLRQIVAMFSQFPGDRVDYYPTDLDRYRMAATFRDNPELLARFRNNPHAIQLDGACNITQVEERGSGTTGPDRQTSPEIQR